MMRGRRIRDAQHPKRELEGCSLFGAGCHQTSFHFLGHHAKPLQAIKVFFSTWSKKFPIGCLGP